MSIRSGKKVTGTFCLKGPKSASHKRCLSPFSCPPIFAARDRASSLARVFKKENLRTGKNGGRSGRPGPEACSDLIHMFKNATAKKNRRAGDHSGGQSPTR